MILVRKCDFCNAQAKYDGKTTVGPWAYMCEVHFGSYGVNIPGLFTKLEVETTMLTCSACKVEKPKSEFYAYFDTRGIARTRTECKECNLARKKAARFHKGR